ncbi:ABC transporter substrate-binding protein [Blastococcus sp. SYSU D00820]
MTAAASLALATAACGGGDDEPNRPEANAELTGEPIIIGLDEDSTGPGASYSVIAGNAIRAAIDQLNATDGILGRPVELVVENDESDPTKTPSIVRKLIDQNPAFLILQSSGAAIAQAKPVVQQAGIPAIAPTSISQSVALPPDADFTYTLANPLNDFVETYCGAFEEAGIETLAVLSDASPTIDGVNGLLLPGLGECVELIAEEEAPVDTSDLSAQVARIEDAGPDAVLVSSVGGNFEVLAHNTLFEQLPDVQRFSLASIGNQAASWELANPGALEGLVFMGSLDPDNERTAELQETLREAYGDDEFQVSAYDANGWDTVMLIKQAIEAAGTDEPLAVRDALNQITGYEASFGQPGFTLSFAPDKHLGADGLCGLVLTVFGEDNRPAGAWETYQPPCD